MKLNSIDPNYCKQLLIDDLPITTQDSGSAQHSGSMTQYQRKVNECKYY